MKSILYSILIGTFSFCIYVLLQLMTCGGASKSTELIVGSFAGAFFTLLFTMIYNKYKDLKDHTIKIFNNLEYSEEYLQTLHVDLFNSLNSLKDFIFILENNKLTFPIKYFLPVQRNLLRNSNDNHITNKLDEILTLSEFLNRTMEHYNNMYNEIKTNIITDSRIIENFDRIESIVKMAAIMHPCYKNIEMQSQNLLDKIYETSSIIRVGIKVYKKKGIFNKFYFCNYRKNNIIDPLKHERLIKEEHDKIQKNLQKIEVPTKGNFDEIKWLEKVINEVATGMTTKILLLFKSSNNRITGKVRVKGTNDEYLFSTTVNNLNPINLDIPLDCNYPIIIEYSITDQVNPKAILSIHLDSFHLKKW